MNCTVCHTHITPQDYDILDAFEEVSPITFRKGNFHRYCYGLLIEQAEETPSEGYTNRMDEFYDKDKSIC
jgi:hypothetical protein